MRANGDGWKSYEMTMLKTETGSIIATTDVYQIPEEERPDQLFLDLFFLDEADPETEQIWGLSLATGHPYDNWVPCAELTIDENRQFQLVSVSTDVPYAEFEIVEDEHHAVKSIVFYNRLL